MKLFRNVFRNIYKNNKKIFLFCGTTTVATGMFINSIIEVNTRINNIDDNKKYNYKEIEKHNNKNDGIWITYKDIVYDVTDFVDNHPGGSDKIMLAAGKSVEPYWNIYKQHTNNPTIIKNILEPMKIGKIENYNPDKDSKYMDPYVNDPIRDSELKFHSISPCNAETPSDYIIDNWITPNNLWYIRNHHPVPKIDKDKYKLKVIDLDSEKHDFTLNELKKIENKKIIATLQCGGNRRNNLNNILKTMGTSWEFGAISNAKWEGVPLYKILYKCGLKDNDIINKRIKHVHFVGEDGVKASIPIKKAIDKYGDVILAYKMNDEELSRDHGFPLRVIVPGHVGIRNIKWLKEIKMSSEEADDIWQKSISYKALPHYITDATKVSLSKIPAIQEMPIQSCIVDIKKDEKLNILKIKGFAWSGGGRRITRVDVSTNSGKCWNMANLREGSGQEYNGAWAWTFWDLSIDIGKNKSFDIYCKAIDEANNTQPDKSSIAWNIRGLNNNSWHNIKYDI